MKAAVDALLMLGGIIALVYAMVRLLYLDGPLGWAVYTYVTTVVARHLLAR